MASYKTFYSYPDSRERPGGALPPAYALVRDLVVEGVRPDRRVGDRRGDAGVVDEAELAHHQELAVPTSAQERNPQTSDVLHVNTTKPVVGCTMNNKNK